MEEPQFKEGMPKEEQPQVFTFSLQVPVFITQEEEVGGMPLEPYIKKLIETGYATEKELVSYIKFVAQFSSIAPFLLDEFLATYRKVVGEEASTKTDLWTPRR